VISAYLVTMTVATPVYGKLGDLFGRRTMMLVALTIFVIGSVLCAASVSLGMLIGSRVIQGIGAGGLMALSQAIVGDLVPPRERGRYQGYFSATYAIASVAGPLLGGVLTQFISWRWVFWVNLPLGLLALYLAVTRLRVLPVKRRAAIIDYPGIVLMSAGLTCLLFALTLVEHRNASSLLSLAGLLGAAALCMALFLRVERRAKEPLIRPGIFGTPGVTGATMLAFLANFQIISLSVLIPLRAQLQLGDSPSAAALWLVPLAFGAPMGAYLGGKTAAHIGRFKPQLVGGSIAMPCALLALAWTPPTTVVTTFIFTLCIGIAAGVQFPVTVVAVQNAVPVADMGVASSTVTLSRSLGGTVGVTVLSTVFLALLDARVLPVLTSTGHPEMSINELFTALAHASGPVLDRARDAAGTSFHTALLLSTAVSLIAVCASWALPNSELRGRTPEKGAAAQAK
jgi:multidrug resistance protein